jgi:SAM-dependent methyltransferase
MSIYNKNWLLKFLDPKNQPQQIKDYLIEESNLLLKNVSKKTCLIDFGCEYGRHLELLKDRLNYGLGIDNTEEYIKLGQKRLKKIKNIELKIADVIDIEIENQFDYAICMNNTLGNIENKETLIANMKKAIFSKGILLFGVYSVKSIEPRIEWYNNTGLKVQKITDDYILTNNKFKS